MTSSLPDKIHICAKFGIDCSNGATGIVHITDRQTNKQTVRRTYLPENFVGLECRERVKILVHKKMSS